MACVGRNATDAARLSQSCVCVSRVLADADAIANANAKSRDALNGMLLS